MNSGKVVWITGASSGIGEELAYAFARLGCKLVISGTRMEQLERVRNKCEMLSADCQVKIICGDISDTKQHPAWLQEVTEAFGERLDPFSRFLSPSSNRVLCGKDSANTKLMSLRVRCNSR